MTRQKSWLGLTINKKLSYLRRPNTLLHHMEGLKEQYRQICMVDCMALCLTEVN